MSKLNVIGVFVFIGLIMFIYWKAKSEDNSLRKYKISTAGICVDIEPVIGGSGLYVNYKFTTLQNDSKADRTRIDIESRHVKEIFQLLGSKVFPVIYDSTDITNGFILVMRKDYLKFNCPIPDSLIPLLNYLDSLDELD